MLCTLFIERHVLFIWTRIHAHALRLYSCAENERINRLCYFGKHDDNHHRSGEQTEKCVVQGLKTGGMLQVCGWCGTITFHMLALSQLINYSERIISVFCTCVSDNFHENLVFSVFCSSSPVHPSFALRLACYSSLSMINRARVKRSRMYYFQEIILAKAASNTKLYY